MNSASRVVVGKGRSKDLASCKQDDDDGVANEAVPQVDSTSRVPKRKRRGRASAGKVSRITGRRMSNTGRLEYEVHLVEMSTNAGGEETEERPEIVFLQPLNIQK